MVHGVKSITISVLTVLACLLANKMHPADHTGDRAAIVLVAGLILTANIQADLGLGTINYLIWQDGLNLILIVVTLLALTQTMVVHRYWYYGERHVIAMAIDRVCNAVLLFWFFPTVVAGYMCLAFPEVEGLGAALLALSAGGSVAGIWGGIQLRMQARRRLEREATAAFKLHDGALPEDVLRRAFEAFDYDETGGLSTVELRKLLHAQHPQVPLKALNAVIKEVRAHHFDQGRISVDAFHAAEDEIIAAINKAGAGRQGRTRQGLTRSVLTLGR